MSGWRLRSREEREWLHAEFNRRRRSQLASVPRAERPAAVRRAMAWLEEHLSCCPQLGSDVKRAAARAGIREKPLRLAREALGIVTTNDGRAGSTWRLP